MLIERTESEGMVPRDNKITPTRGKKTANYPKD